MKPEITQKVKFVHSLDTHQDATANQSPVAIPGQPSGWAKLASLFGNHRSRTSSVILGLAVSIGISSFPTNCVDALAKVPSVEAIPTDSIVDAPTDPYIRQLHNDISAMRSPAATQNRVLIAQSLPTTRVYPLSVANRTDTNSLQFGSEASVSIDVPAPKNRSFKFVPTTQAYNPSVSGDEGYQESNPINKTGETSIGFSWPATGTLTSRFGRRWGRMHKGIDIAGPVGTPIDAAADGTVIAAGWNAGGYGNLVEIRHSDGTTTRYGHNSRLSVSVGQIVRQGQQVAEMGSTGHSTGSHLHFEIRPSGGDAVNPIAHLPTNS